MGRLHPPALAADLVSRTDLAQALHLPDPTVLPVIGVSQPQAALARICVLWVRVCERVVAPSRDSIPSVMLAMNS